MPLAHHGGVRRGCVSAGARIGWPERRGSAVHRETHERRGWGVGGAYVATVAWDAKLVYEDYWDYERF